MTTSNVRITKAALLAFCAFSLPFSAVQAQKYYKLTEPVKESADGSKPKPPEPSKPVDPNMFKKFLVVDLSAQRVDLYEAGSVTFTTPASSGREDKPTRNGVYKVTNKHEKWTSTIYGVPMPYFLRLNNSDTGLHAGILPGYPGSAGCIRLPEDSATFLFKNVAIGTPVLIQGQAPDKEWIKSQYKVKRALQSNAFSRSSKANNGQEWKPPYPIIPTSWSKSSDSAQSDPPKPEAKKKKTST